MSARQPASNALVAAAFALTMSSAFGQTYFIAIFAPWLKAELGLTDGGFGMLYAVATTASAAALVWGGKVADVWPVRRLGPLAILALAAMCVAMSVVSVAWMLLPILFGLRLFGQGAMGHLAITGTGRWYVRRRGRMLSIAVLGFPASEAVMPIVAVSLIASIGWRETWLAAASVLVAVSIPVVMFLLRKEPPPSAVEPFEITPGIEQRSWTRAEVIRRPEFFAVVAGIVVPSFAMTGIFFHQVHLVEVKGWTMPWFAGWFPLYAITSVATALMTGWLVDRYAARRFLPLFLMPMAVGIAVLATSRSPWAVPMFMLLGALTNGAASTLIAAVWAELFGTRHLGSIRAIAFAGQVLASALAPGLIGLLLDPAVPIETQYWGMVVYAVVSMIWLRTLLPRLDRIASEGSIPITSDGALL